MTKKSEKLEAWKKRRVDFKKSGLSRRAYCEKAKIRESTLDYWFSRIRKLEKNRGLVEIHPAAAVQTPGANLVVTTGKYRIEVNGSTGISLLVQTLKALENSANKSLQLSPVTNSDVSANLSPPLEFVIVQTLRRLNSSRSMP